MRIDHFGLIHAFDNALCKIVTEPFLLKSILKIDFCVVNCLRHIAEKNVQHRIKTFREGILR